MEVNRIKSSFAVKLHFTFPLNFKNVKFVSYSVIDISWKVLKRYIKVSLKNLALRKQIYLHPLLLIL